ncbi:hypothetical protein ACWEPB_19185 [Kitasatospora cineracea]
MTRGNSTNAWLVAPRTVREPRSGQAPGGAGRAPAVRTGGPRTMPAATADPATADPAAADPAAP